MANGHGGARPNTGGARAGAGRKKKEHLATFRELVEAVVTPTDFEEMVQAMVERAKAGDTRAFAQIMDRYYGKATEHVVTEQIGNTTPVRIIFEEKPAKAGGD